jgi:hypothetical protein
LVSVVVLTSARVAKPAPQVQHEFAERHRSRLTSAGRDCSEETRL